MKQEHFSDNEDDKNRIYAEQYMEMERNDEGFWKRFEKSGAILDYLSYSACTKELSSTR